MYYISISFYSQFDIKLVRAQHAPGSLRSMLRNLLHLYFGDSVAKQVDHVRHQPHMIGTVPPPIRLAVVPLDVTAQRVVARDLACHRRATISGNAHPVANINARDFLLSVVCHFVSSYVSPIWAACPLRSQDLSLLLYHKYAKTSSFDNTLTELAVFLAISFWMY